MALRLWGHRSIEPSAVDDQSNDRMTEAISPGLSRKVPKTKLTRHYVANWSFHLSLHASTHTNEHAPERLDRVGAT